MYQVSSVKWVFIFSGESVLRLLSEVKFVARAGDVDHAPRNTWPQAWSYA